MASYVVMEPPGGGAARAELVRDRFTFIGFLFPPVWLLWHKLWIAALVVVALLLALAVLGELAGRGPVTAGLSLLVSVYVGLEGPALRLNALQRRGWQGTGVVEAGSRDDAEMRLLAARELPAAPPAPRPAVPAAPARQVRQGPALSLLDPPGR